MQAFLSYLPTEIVENVAFYVEEKEDLSALRLVCTELCRKTLNVFIKVFYHTIETSLSKISIRRLYHIAKQEDLRDKVRELHFVARGEVKRGDLFLNTGRILQFIECSALAMSGVIASLAESFSGTAPP